MHNSKLQLLAGLLDTDGYCCNKTGYDFVQKLEAVFDGVEELCAGLSFRMTKQEKVCNHSSLCCVGRLQDVSGGKPVRVGDTNLWGMEIDVAAAAEEIRNIGKADKDKGVEDVLGSFGLGAFADQLKDLRLSKGHSSNAHWLVLFFQTASAQLPGYPSCKVLAVCLISLLLSS